MSCAPTAAQDPSSVADGSAAVIAAPVPNAAPAPAVSADAATEPAVAVYMFGEPGAADPAIPGRVQPLYVFLTAHSNRGYTSSKIRSAIRPYTGEKSPPEWSERTLSDYAGELRRHIGEEALPDARQNGGYYTLRAKADTDWARFQRAVSKAAGQPDVWAVDTLIRALDELRGPPFDTTDDVNYGWARSEGLVDEMEKAVANAVHRVVEILIDEERPEEAMRVVRRGIGLAPGRPRSLAEDLLRAAAAEESSDGLERAMERAQELVPESFDELAPLIDDLRRQRRERYLERDLDLDREL